VAFCYTAEDNDMARSIRVSDVLFTEAEREARLMHRSIAAQVEHWAGLGRALESAGLTIDAIRSALRGTGERQDAWLDIAKRAYQEQSRQSVREGLPPEALHLVPRSVLRRARVRFPDVDFGD
jgi:hypothetical protein